MKPQLTISTGPIPFFYYRKKLSIFYHKNYKQKIKGITPLPEALKMYGGHYGVARSLIHGLQELGTIDFNYNPNSLSKLADTVIVLGGGLSPIKQGIKLKKTGRIKKLVVGPNVAVWPFEELGAPEIDLLITPSSWPGQFWADVDENISLKKLRAWPAGVDVKYWVPDSEIQPNKTGKKLLFYKKRPIKSQYEACWKIAKNNGFEVIELVPGNYSFEDYKELLNQVDFLVHFVEQESQGLSTLEAWAMNVPTIVWNPGYWHYRMRNFKSSSAPYMTNKTGTFFKDESEFEQLIQENYLQKELYQPRNWVLKNMTDSICAQKLLDIIF